MYHRKSTGAAGHPRRPPLASRAAAALVLALAVLALSLAGATPSSAVAAEPSSTVAAEPSSAAAMEPSSAAGAGLGGIGSRYGVNQPHLKWHTQGTIDRELAEMKAAGIGRVRIDFAWPDLEPSRGQWEFSRMDVAVEKCRQNGIEVLGILLFSPAWANGTSWFTTAPTDMQAWREYVITVCSRYRGKVAAWEIWNEENINAFWSVGPDPLEYVALVSVAAPEIRAADPAAKVVMGGVAGLDPDYLTACLKAGIARYVDTVSYHPYVYTLAFWTLAPIEANCRQIVSWVRDLVAQHSEKPLEIWLTELGWTSSSIYPGVDRDTQAVYMLRTFINYASQGVDRVYWYNLYDESYNPADPEANYGLLANDLSRKPVYGAYKVFQENFGRALAPRPSAAAFTCSNRGSLEAHSFDLPDGGVVMGLWKADDAADTLALEMPGASLRMPVLVDPVTGAETAVAGAARKADGGITVTGLPVGKRPVILRFDSQVAPRLDAVAPASAAPGEQVTLAGTGFGDERGTSGVSFGAAEADVFASWTDGQVTCEVPDLPQGPLQVRVVTPAGASNAVAFDVEAAAEGLSVSSVSPGSGLQGMTVSVSDLAGSGFSPGASVALESAGSTVGATDVNVVSSTRITCTFDLRSCPAGRYDVVVRSASGQEGRLPAGFKVDVSVCGAGGATGMMALGLTLSLLALTGGGAATTRRKRADGR